MADYPRYELRLKGVNANGTDRIIDASHTGDMLITGSNFRLLVEQNAPNDEFPRLIMRIQNVGAVAKKTVKKTAKTVAKKTVKKAAKKTAKKNTR